ERAQKSLPRNYPVLPPPLASPSAFSPGSCGLRAPSKVGHCIRSVRLFESVRLEWLELTGFARPKKEGQAGSHAASCLPIPSELEADAQLGCEWRAARRDLVQHSVLQTIDRLPLARHRRERRASLGGAGPDKVATRQTHEAAVVGIGVKIAPVSQVKDISDQAQGRALAKFEL